MYKVYLDPGHGGIDPGAEGYGNCEADRALDIAKRVCAMLPCRYFKVKMSRSSNHTPNDSNPAADLGRRAAEANAWGADIFVSIHLNAGGGHGVETYRSVAGGQSTTLATDIQQSVQSATGFPAHGEPVKTKIGDGGHDWICVIRETNMPACLVECGFIDTKADMDAWSADKFAHGIYNGICKYFGMRTAVAVPSAAADTTKDMAMGRLSVYQVKTYSGAKLSSGNSQIALVIPRTSDLWYVVAVGSSGQAAGIYTTLPGQKAVKAFKVAIK